MGGVKEEMCFENFFDGICKYVLNIAVNIWILSLNSSNTGRPANQRQVKHIKYPGNKSIISNFKHDQQIIFIENNPLAQEIRQSFVINIFSLILN